LDKWNVDRLPQKETNWCKQKKLAQWQIKKRKLLLKSKFNDENSFALFITFFSVFVGEKM
jgi:hypothetical protein